ncbi:MAG TPA: translation elongation factor Ts [Halanaerobiales bacterium]|nr:translation elongation factor Ts [Halanaerobiales bacterium]
MANMKDIRELRERTGAGVMDCKKALEENNNDVEAAVEYLREKGMAAAAKKAGRIATEGKVNVLINDGKKKGIIAEINSETDFVAKNEKFQTLVSDISIHLLKSSSKEIDDVLKEEWERGNTKDVNTVIKEAIAEIGENINLRRFERYETGGFLQGYIHLGGKIGVLVELNAEYNEDKQRVAKDIAMHIAASNPGYIDREEIEDEVISKERSIYREQMLNEGKPEHIIDKIVDGKMDKFYSQVCLLEQEFIRDTDITVGQLLKEKGIMVSKFTRYELGEGIEKKEEDFAEEVMREVKGE